MRALMPLAVLALAACDPPFEERFPSRFYTISHHTVPYEMRAQYDPFERGWFIRVTSLTHPLELSSEPSVLAAIQQQLAPSLCESGALAIRQGEVWNPFTVKEVLFLPELGAFQFVGRCSEVPVTPQEIAIFAPDGALIAVEGAGAVGVGVEGEAGVVVDPRAPSDVLISVPAEGW